MNVKGDGRIGKGVYECTGQGKVNTETRSCGVISPEDPGA